MERLSPRPDVLDLIARIEGSDEIQFRKQASAPDEIGGEILEFGNVPLGLTASLMPYHSFVGSFSPDSTLVLLGPALRSSVNFPTVPVATFEESLKQLLSDGLRSWTLICERDCDQEPLLYLDSESAEAKEAFGELFSFLRGDPQSYCPTFVITKGIPCMGDID